jgi:hypothetical protein
MNVFDIFDVFDVLVHILSFIGFPQLSKFGTINKIWFDAIENLYSRKLTTSYESQWFFVDCELKNLARKQWQPKSENEMIHGYLSFMITKGIRVLITEINKSFYLHIKSNHNNSYFYEIFNLNDYDLVGGFHRFSDQVFIIHTIKKPQQNTRVDFIVDFNDFPAIKTRTKTINLETSSGAPSILNTVCPMCSDKFVAQLTFSNGNIDLNCSVIDSHVFRIFNIFDYQTITNVYCNNIIKTINFFGNKFILYSVNDVSQNYQSFWEIVEIGENLKQTRLSKSCQEMLAHCFIEEIHKIESDHFLISVKVGSLITKKSNRLFHLIKTKENWELIPIEISTLIKTIVPFKCPITKKWYFLQEPQMFQKVEVHEIK